MKYKMKKPDMKMSHKEFMEEHRKLIDILRFGTEEERLAEADEQEEEMMECMGNPEMEKD